MKIYSIFNLQYFIFQYINFHFTFHYNLYYIHNINNINIYVLFKIAIFMYNAFFNNCILECHFPFTTIRKENKRNKLEIIIIRKLHYYE